MEATDATQHSSIQYCIVKHCFRMQEPVLGGKVMERVELSQLSVDGKEYLLCLGRGYLLEFGLHS